MQRIFIQSTLLLGSLVFTIPGLAASPADISRREIGNLVLENIPEIPANLKERLSQYENIRSSSLQDWLPGNQGILISTRFAEAAQLHTVRNPLQYRKQITFYDEPIASAKVNPRKSELLFLKDQGGNENTQIYLKSLETGETTLLTDGKSRNEGAIWDQQGRFMAFASSMRNGRDTDVYIQDLSKQNSKAELIVQEGGSWAPIQFSFDGDKIAIIKAISANENRLFIYDRKTEKLEELFANQKQSFGSVNFSKDGQRLFFASDVRGEFKTLFVYSFKNKSLQAISEKILWDVEAVDLDADGKYLVFSTNENGWNRIYRLDTKTLAYKELHGIPNGQISGMRFHPENPLLLAMTLSSATAPADVYVYNFKNSKLEAWTESETGGLNPKQFVDAELIQYPSFDQHLGKAREIPAFLYKPRERKGRLPVIISIHGGPEAQFRPGFSANIQYFTTELGVAVIAPNVRGSSGYGKTYLTLDNGFKREDSVKDIGMLLDWIAQQSDLDPTKVVVMGGSYGGYMTLAALTHYSDRLAGGVDTVGISHFLSFLGNTKSYRQDLRRVEYGDERDPEMKAFLDKISPLTNVAKIQKPLFVVQGLNDPRVPASEAEQIVKAVRESGQEAWYLLAKDEGHGFRKKFNQSINMQATILFLEKILGATKTSANP